MENDEGTLYNHTTMTRAVLHMVGQAQYNLEMKTTTSQIAYWMGCSKPTARRRMVAMVKSGDIKQAIVAYRENAVMHYWKLSDSGLEQYKDGAFVGDYWIYMRREFGW